MRPGTLREISKPGFTKICAHNPLIDRRPKSCSAAEGVAFSADSEGGMFGFFLLDALPQNYVQVMKSTCSL